MTSSPAWLRRDLSVFPMPGGRACVVVDDIGGRFSRTMMVVWRSLTESSPPPPNLLAQATAAGWTRRQVAKSSLTIWSLLSYRMPLVSIDPIARALQSASAVVFSRLAIVAWLMLSVITTIVVVTQWDRVRGGLPSLTLYLQTVSPLTLGIVFVLTKTAHELGHAVLCRRLGSRCGVFGLWWFLSIPCPFVDVTDVWRQPTPLHRAAVMAAGMFVELIIAILATWCWLLSSDPTTRMLAMHVMLVCGVSTILFNANPLVRYDGYYLISDLLDVTNLRETARAATRSALENLSRRRVSSLGTWTLVAYHVAARTYLLLLWPTIATVLLVRSESYGGLRMTASLIGLTAIVAVIRWLVDPSGDDSLTRSRWITKKRMVRAAIAGGLLVVITAPTPRCRSVEGIIRAASAREVFLPRSGVLQHVHVRLGDYVVAGQPLADIVDTDLQIEQADLLGRQNMIDQKVRAARMASLKTNRVQRSTAPQPDDWQTLVAASQSLAESRAALQQKLDACHVLAPVSGRVLPPLTDQVGRHPRQLDPNVGQPVSQRDAWCRIASDESLHVIVSFSSRDHAALSGPDSNHCVTQVLIPSLSKTWLAARIESVSPMTSTDSAKEASAPATATGISSSPRWHIVQRAVQIIASIQPTELVNNQSTIESDQLLQLDGASAHFFVRLPNRALADDLLGWLRDAWGS